MIYVAKGREKEFQNKYFEQIQKNYKPLTTAEGYSAIVGVKEEEKVEQKEIRPS